MERRLAAIFAADMVGKATCSRSPPPGALKHDSARQLNRPLTVLLQLHKGVAAGAQK